MRIHAWLIRHWTHRCSLHQEQQSSPVASVTGIHSRIGVVISPFRGGQDEIKTESTDWPLGFDPMRDF
jgi:hypothetical protein